MKVYLTRNWVKSGSGYSTEPSVTIHLSRPQHDANTPLKKTWKKTEDCLICENPTHVPSSIQGLIQKAEKTKKDNFYNGSDWLELELTLSDYSKDPAVKTKTKKTTTEKVETEKVDNDWKNPFESLI